MGAHTDAFSNKYLGVLPMRINDLDLSAILTCFCPEDAVGEPQEKHAIKQARTSPNVAT